MRFAIALTLALVLIGVTVGVAGLQDSHARMSAGTTSTADESGVLTRHLDLPTEPVQFKSIETVVLSRSFAKEIYLLIGVPGEDEGSFAFVDDEFLPRDEAVVATLIYEDRDGREREHRTKLRERC